MECIPKLILGIFPKGSAERPTFHNLATCPLLLPWRGQTIIKTNSPIQDSFLDINVITKLLSWSENKNCTLTVRVKHVDENIFCFSWFLYWYMSLRWNCCKENDYSLQYLVNISYFSLYICVQLYLNRIWWCAWLTFYERAFLRLVQISPSCSFFLTTGIPRRFWNMPSFLLCKEALNTKNNPKKIYGL